MQNKNEYVWVIVLPFCFWLAITLLLSVYTQTSHQFAWSSLNGQNGTRCGTCYLSMHHRGTAASHGYYNSVNTDKPRRMRSGQTIVFTGVEEFPERPNGNNSNAVFEHIKKRLNLTSDKVTREDVDNGLQRLMDVTALATINNSSTDSDGSSSESSVEVDEKLGYGQSTYKDSEGNEWVRTVTCVKSQYYDVLGGVGGKVRLYDEAESPTGLCRFNPSRNLFEGWDDGFLYRYVDENTVVEHVVESHPGYLISVNEPNKGCSIAARGMYRLFRIRDQKINGVYYAKKDLYLYYDLLKRFSREFATATNPANIITACLATGSKYAHRKPDVVADTINFYGIYKEKNADRMNNVQFIARREEQHALFLGNSDWVKQNMHKERVLFDSPVELESELCHFGFLPTQKPGTLDFYDVTDDIPEFYPDPLVWKHRVDYVVTKLHGAQYPDRRKPGLAMRFDTMHKNDSRDKYKKILFFDIHGSNRFITYANHPRNALLATKRFTSVRLDIEDDCIMNQLDILGNVLFKVGYRKYRHYARQSDKITKVLGFRVELFDHEISDTDSVPLITNLGMFINPFNRPHGKFINAGREHNFRFNAYTRFMARWLLKDVAHTCRATVQRWYDKYRSCKHWLYYKGFDLYLSCLAPIFGREFAAALPHIKMALRQAYVKGVLLHDSEDIMVKRLNACVKEEFAKPGKFPRLFVTYEAGCMYANELPEFLKACYDGEDDIKHKGFVYRRIVIAKPLRSSIGQVFNLIIQQHTMPNVVLHVIYSDDSILAGNIRGKCFAGNADIEMSDSTIRELLFYLMGLKYSNFSSSLYLGMLRQCMLPVTIQNPFNHSEMVQLQFDGPMLGSGNCSTTVLNHDNSKLFGLSVFYHLVELDVNHTLSDEQLVSIIEGSALRAGVKITYESVYSRHEGFVAERLQFLKHSPIMTCDGEWVPCLNLGCMLRSLGVVEHAMSHEKLGVTPEQFASMSLNEMMEIFWSRVVMGFVNQPKNIILDALRHRFDLPVEPINGKYTLSVVSELDQFDYVGETEFQSLTDLNLLSGSIPIQDYSSKRLDTASIMRRYDCSLDELVDLADAYTCLKFGTVYESSALSKIYRVDYGLKE